MRYRFFSFSPFFLSTGFAAVRIITGALMIYHGVEIFDADKMKGYSNWLNDLKFPAPALMAYLGKGTEFISGLLLLLGLFTRLAALALAITMLLVCFGIGHGKIFTDDQHPFLFVLLAAIFFFTGAGKWSLDHFIFGYKNPFS
jgi:putative oxidoreductase